MSDLSTLQQDDITIWLNNVARSRDMIISDDVTHTLKKITELYLQLERSLAELLETIKQQQVLFFSQHEEEINALITVSFTLIALLRIILTIALGPLPHLINSLCFNLWNTFEGLAVFVAAPANFIQAHSMADMVRFTANLLGGGALLAALALWIAMATTAFSVPALIIPALILFACYTDVYSFGQSLYNAYQLAKKDNPTINPWENAAVIEQRDHLTSSVFAAVGFSMLFVAPIILFCPPAAIALFAISAVCIGISAVFKVKAIHFFEKKETATIDNGKKVATGDNHYGFFTPTIEKTAPILAPKVLFNKYSV